MTWKTWGAGLAVGGAVLFGLFQIAALPKGNAHSAIEIVIPRSGGSGVHIGGGYVLTAAHVVSAGPMKVHSTADEFFVPEVLWSNKDYDIALLKIEKPTMATAGLACRAPVPGEAIYTIGNPFGMQFIRTSGYVASSKNIKDELWKSTFVADMTVGPGNSGGPVFDRHGSVLGIVVGVYRGFAFALIVPSTVVCTLLARGN